MAKIMVVDDEPNIVMVLKEILTDAGHEVLTASNGLTGWEMMLQTVKPDLLILDLFMPGMTGSQFIHKMAANSDYDGIPVILLTGSIPDKNNFPPGGSYQDFICKPFNIDEVVLKAERLLKRQKRSSTDCCIENGLRKGELSQSI